MTIAFLSVPTPQHYHHQVQLHKPKNLWSTSTSPCFSKILVPPSQCSPSSTPTPLISSLPGQQLDVPNLSKSSTQQRYHHFPFYIKTLQLSPINKLAI